MAELSRLSSTSGPHRGQPVYGAGEPLAQARAAGVFVHGRGATVADILELARVLAQPGIAYLAPQAAGDTWYPQRFIAPVADNEPWLSSALAAVGAVLENAQAAGVPLERTLLLGFSQGACLVLEYVARHPRRYGGVIGLSGALIGPDGSRPTTTAPVSPGLASTPIFLGCSEADFHIPRYRVEQAAAELERLGGAVTLQLYPEMGHTINEDELSFVREPLAQLDDTV
jgi:predicted esterase